MQVFPSARGSRNAEIGIAANPEFQPLFARDEALRPKVARFQRP
jgi:hypothetical protein